MMRMLRLFRVMAVVIFGGGLAALQDDAGRPAARFHRADDLGPGTLLVPFAIPDIGAVRIEHAARPGRIMRLREIDGGLEAGGGEGVGQGGDSGAVADRAGLASLSRSVFVC